MHNVEEIEIIVIENKIGHGIEMTRIIQVRIIVELFSPLKFHIFIDFYCSGVANIFATGSAR